jgi:hypothetical protein
MSDAPYGGPPPAPQGTPPPAHLPQGSSHPQPYGPQPWTVSTDRPARPSRLPLVLVSIVAVLALGLAAASWLRPLETDQRSAPTHYGQDEISEARKAMCAAWDTSFKAVTTSGRKTSPDTTVNYVIGIQTQLAFHVAASHLRTELRRHPATPEPLAAALERMAVSSQDLVLARLSEASESEVNAIRSEMDEAEKDVKQECDD